VAELTRTTLQPEQWAKVRELYSRFAGLPHEEQQRKLDDCNLDAQVKTELQRLLGTQTTSSSFLAQPAFELMNMPVAPLLEIEPGTILANRYVVRRYLSSGGMGEVYEVWDLELQESIALKVIQPEIACVPHAIERFKQEVKQARRVTHPNICRVYDLASHDLPDGTRLWFLTMQLLGGKTLSDTIRESGPIPPKRALVWIGQLVAGLQAAHELGIVHRDFKSANVMLVPLPVGTYRAVITDFGLAASVVDAKTDGSIHKGQGTPAYAPPEQWSGGEVSPSADQYSLGVVMCEMFTGERPIAPELGHDQNWSRAKLPSHPNLNPRVRAAIARCLEGDPHKRFASVGDLNNALGIGRQRMLLRMLAIPAAMLLIAIAVRAVMSKPVTYALKDLAPVTSSDDVSLSPSLSDDGSVMAYTAQRRGKAASEIYVQHPPSRTVIPLTNDGMDNDYPSVSSNGKVIAYVSGRTPGGVSVVSSDGKQIKYIAEEGRDPRISPDGKSVLYWTGNEDVTRASAQIFIRYLDQEKPVRLATGFADARYPIWNSDGRHILFRGCKSKSQALPTCWDWWVTTVDAREPKATGLRARLESQRLKMRGDPGRWFGSTMFFNTGDNEPVHLSAVSIPPSDTPRAGHIEAVGTANARERVFCSSLSDSGALALTDLTSAVHVWKIDSGAPVDSDVELETDDTNRDFEPSISSNGRWLVFVRLTGGKGTIEVLDRDTKLEHSIQPAGADVHSPLIDDDGTTIAFESWENDRPAVFLSSKGSPAKALCSDCRISAGWFNGTEGLFIADGVLSTISLYDLKTAKRTPVLSAAKSTVAQATWSPASQMLLFTASLDSIHSQVFTARFSGEERKLAGEWHAITEPSQNVILPRWSGDGRTIFYLADQINSIRLWGRRFDPTTGRATGDAFVVRNFRGKEFTPETITRESLNMSVAGDQIFMNIAQISSRVWMGKLQSRNRLAQIFTPY
jgi:serine/threonine protein kinase/WD40 repeat protein